MDEALKIIAYISLGLVAISLVYSVFIQPMVKKKIKKKQEERVSNTINSLKKGNKLLTTSGIRCIFVKSKGDVVFVKVADNVIIQIDKHSIMGVYK